MKSPWARPMCSQLPAQPCWEPPGTAQLCPSSPAYMRLTSPYPSSQLLLLALLTLVLPSWGKSSRKTGESRSSLPTSVNCRGLWLATWGCRGLLGSRKLSTWPNKPPVLCNQQGGHQGMELWAALGPFPWEETCGGARGNSGLSAHLSAWASQTAWFQKPHCPGGETEALRGDGHAAALGGEPALCVTNPATFVGQPELVAPLDTTGGATLQHPSCPGCLKDS